MSLNKDLLSRRKKKFDKVLKDINRFYLEKILEFFIIYEELNFEKLSKSNYFKKQQFHKNFG